MAGASIFVILTVMNLVSTQLANATNSRLTEDSLCMSVEEIPLCSQLGYVNTSFPNLRGHTTPEEANEELSHFLALVYTGCSNAIIHLLCSIYAPVCIQKYPQLKLLPCKNLCEYVKDGCAEILWQEFGYNWPPGPHLDCYNYEDNQLCFGPSDPSILRIPPIIQHPDPPKNFAATLLSPSTVCFTWDPPKSNENEVFILTCEPQPYQFPLSTSETKLRATHFTPDTNYVCTMFTAQTANFKNSTSSVEFRTAKLGPPQSFVARHQSPNDVKLLWNHPDSEISTVQQENYLYILSCHSRESNFQVSAKGESTVLEDLLANTQYTCQVSLAPSLTQNETATITFTTLEPLEIHFINDTPHVHDNSVRLEFRINRPVNKATCRILGHSEKQNCSNNRALFQNIPEGTRTLRIVVENNKKDKLILKIKLYVSGSNTCGVNLINDRISYLDRSVIIYFKGTNSINQFRCSLNKQASFKCYPPLFLRSLERERHHQVKITPISNSDMCEHNAPLVTQFTVQ